MSFGFTLDTRKLDGLGPEMEKRIRQALERTAAEVEGLMADHAHMITGAMRAGLYTSTPEESGYEAAAASAKALKPDVIIVPEVPPPPPGEVYIADATVQAYFEEYGTATRPPHAFMGPAMLEAPAIMDRNLEDVGRGV